MELQEGFLLLEIEWHIRLLLVIHMQLSENGLHHSPVEPAFCHVLQQYTMACQKALMQVANQNAMYGKAGASAVQT